VHLLAAHQHRNFGHRVRHGGPDRQQLHARRLGGDRLKPKAQLQPSAMEAKALVAIKARVSELDLLVGHVRGHKRGQQRQWVNRMRDAEARRHMLAERARLDAEPGPIEQGASGSGQSHASFATGNARQGMRTSIRD
jgi:hypothetical protein